MIGFLKRKLLINKLIPTGGVIYPISKLVKKIIDISGTGIEPVYVDKPTDLFEIYHQSLSSQKIKKRFNWKPSFSLSEGLKRTLEGWK